MRRRNMLLIICLICCLVLCNCAGNAREAGVLLARDEINLGEDANSRAASLVMHVMQICDLYTNRLDRLTYIPDTSEMRLAAASMRRENDVYTIFLTGFASALYNARPIIGKGNITEITETDIDIEFSITDSVGIRYEGRIDINSAACYVFKYEGTGWQYLRFIGDENGYYIELMCDEGDGEWYTHRAYYSPRKWYNAYAKLDGEPTPDLVYHFLPEDFERHIKGMPPLIRRMEYELDKHLQYWDYSYGHELIWDLSDPTASPTPFIK